MHRDGRTIVQLKIKAKAKGVSYRGVRRIIEVLLTPATPLMRGALDFA